MEDLGFTLNLAAPFTSSPILLSPAGGWGNIIGCDASLTTFYASPTISNPPPTAGANGQLVTFSSVPSGSSPITLTKVITSGESGVTSLRYILNGGSVLVYSTGISISAGNTLKLGLTTTAVSPAVESGNIFVRDALNRLISVISYSVDIAV